jgi:hypothetical protein
MRMTYILDDEMCKKRLYQIGKALGSFEVV